MAKKAKKTTTPVTTIYTNENCGYCTTMKAKFNEKEVKFVEKERSEHVSEWGEISRLTGLPTFPTLEFNGNYYVPGRDFQNPQQSIGAIKILADPDLIHPSSERLMLEMMKTQYSTMKKSIQQLNRQITPITKIMNQLIEEDKKENEKENK